MPEESKHIELSVLEPLGVDRPAYPITMGVPFPQGALRTDANLRVEAGGRGMPLQTRTMLAWPDGSVKWVLLDIQTDLEAGKDNRCHLFYGDAVSSTEKAEHDITIEQDEDRLAVTTGPLAFSVDSTGTFPLHSVVCSGRTIVPEGALRSEMTVDGQPKELRVTSSPELEEAGPLRAVVKVDGKAVSKDGEESFDVTARIYVYAGHPTLRIYLTLTNRLPKRLVHLESWKIRLTPRLKADPDGFIISSGGRHTAEGLIDGTRKLRIGLVDTDFAPWLPETHGMEAYETPEKVKRAAPQCTVIPGENGEPELHRPGADWATMLPGAGVLGDDEITVTFSCRHPWHNAPKEIEVNTGAIELSLYPNWAEPLEWHRGVAKTHELLLDFRPGKPDPEERLAFTCGFEKQPAPQVGTRNWIVDSGALGPVFRYQPEKYRWWESVFRSALHRHTFNRESQEELGATILDYGDYWSTRRGGQWYNNEMDKGFALMLQMVRTGYAVIMEAVEPIIHHQIDVDTIHDAEEGWWIGAQRYHFAKHGVAHSPTLCHEWIDGPLFYYLLTGYKRAEEVALARADHFCKAIKRGAHRVKTLARVSGYPLMALSRMYENYGDQAYLEACDMILDWLDEWYDEEGGYFYIGFGPPGRTKVATGLSGGILACAFMRHTVVTGSDRSWNMLKRHADEDIARTGLFNPEGFVLKTNNQFRDYYAPEPDFYFEALAYLTDRTGDPRYADLAYANMQRIFAQRQMLHNPSIDAHFYRYWLPFLARADKLGILTDPKPF